MSSTLYKKVLKWKITWPFYHGSHHRDTCRLTSGYVFIMAGGAVTWSSKRQATVVLSTVEAEYVAMSRCAQQMVWMQSWLDEVSIEHELPGLMKGDSRGAIALTKNTKDHGKVKHIDIRHHYIRELAKSGKILMEQVPSAENIADLFTKPLSQNHHHRLLASLNIYWGPFVHGRVLNDDRKVLLSFGYPFRVLIYHFMIIFWLLVISAQLSCSFFICII